MDKLDFLFKKQKELQELIGYDNITFDNNYFNLMFIGCITELNECIECTKWKPWKKSSINNIPELQKEVIDLWHFVINLTLASGLNANDLFNMYIEKNKINIDKQVKGY